MNCSRNTAVCGYQSGPQDNWLITQYINNTARRDMYISVKFTIYSQCTDVCSTVLDVYVLETDEVNQTFARNVNNFPSRPVAALTDIVRDGTTLTTDIRHIGSSSTPGVYVAFRDHGTCIGLTEVVVYYPICDASSPMVGANFLRDGIPGETVNGMCYPNMATDVNMPARSFEAMCVLNGRTSLTSWNRECICVPGYSFISRLGSNQCRGKYCACSFNLYTTYSTLHCAVQCSLLVTRAVRQLR